jgi:hypothetical protein
MDGMSGGRMKLRLPLALTIATAAAAAAATDCGGAERVTELVVVVDGDLTFPDEVDRVTVVADDGNGHTATLPAPGVARPPSGWRLPLWGSVAARGELRPITFTATAFRGTDVVLSESVVAEFVRDESREVRLTLCKGCRDKQCGEGERCGENGCTGKRVSSLPPWSGGEPARTTCAVATDEDAGNGDAGLDASDPACDAGPDAAVPPVMPVSAFNAGHPDYPHTCNIDAVLVQDDVVAGLDYSIGDPEIGDSLITIAGSRVSGCVGVDFGAARALDRLEVRARAIRDDSRSACPAPGCKQVIQPDRCAACCSPCVEATDPDSGVLTNYCIKGGELYAFVGTTLGTYERAEAALPSVPVSTVLRSYAFDTGGKVVRYAVVCRGADGPATADLEVDAVKGIRACP